MGWGVAQSDVPGWGWALLRWTSQGEVRPFCDGLTGCVVIPPAALGVVDLVGADDIVAVDVKCIDIKISVYYQLNKNRIYILLGLI